ncbi:uncharacterized protein [Hetaerina americana]|uniref:uncharacterized protein isoform X2 n=1 Tax=Hetaerina americana TaxID=62018 RepID=UPI003A7F4A2A
MATVRQTVVTRQTTSSSGAPIILGTETQRSPQSPEWDNTLDALLEDLQTSVSRPGSAAGGSISRSGSRGPGSINGPLATGSSPAMSSTRTYREVRTIQQHGVAGESGQPVPPVRDFNNVQYLMAANPTHIVAERAASPINPEYQMSPGNLSEVSQQKTVTAYKTISYQYNTSDPQQGHPGSGVHESISVQPLPPPPVLSPSATPPAQRRHRTPSGSGKVDVQLRQNLNELDNLLDDLNHAQRAAALRAQTASPTGRSKRSPSPGPPEVVRGTRGIDPSLLEEPLDHSTPVNRHVSRTVRTYRYDTQYGGGDSPHDGPHQEGPPTPGRHSLPRQIQGTPTPPRDIHYSPEPRHMQPTPPPSQTTVRTYTYTGPGAPPPQTPPSSRGRSIPRTHESPSPARHHPPTPVHDDVDDDRSGPNDPLMPGSPRRTTTTTTVRTYTYQLPGSGPNSDNQPEPHPQPERHPQPIPAPPPPSEHLTYHVTPRQPQQVTELRPQPNPQTTVVTYKFTTSSGGPQPGIPEPNDRSPRPFPVDETDTLPSSQQPPKRLDDLMASFGDPTPNDPHQRPEAHPVTTTRYTVEEKVASPPPPISEGNGVGPKAGGTRAAPSPDRPKTTNIAGPPVYYPPGVEMFAKKDAPVQARMKESESSSKGESKSAGGGAAVVPVCLPLCCAMPCVIM